MLKDGKLFSSKMLIYTSKTQATSKFPDILVDSLVWPMAMCRWSGIRKELLIHVLWRNCLTNFTTFEKIDKNDL